MENITKLVNLKLVNSKLSSNVDLIDEVYGNRPTAQRFSSIISKFDLLTSTDDENVHLYSTIVKLDVDSVIVKDGEQPGDELFENNSNLLFQISIEYRIVFELLDDFIDLEDDKQLSAVRTDIMNQFQPYMRSALQGLTNDSYFDGETIPVKLF